MFKFVEPKFHCFNRFLIKPILQKIKEHNILNDVFQDYKEATFILAEDDINGIYGGAFLLKKKLSFLHKKFGKTMSSLASRKGEVWICTICIEMKDKSLFSNFETYFKAFYKELYEKLFEFGIRKDIGYLCLVLDPGEHIYTEVIGIWPYVSEVQSQASFDGLFQGVLSLNMEKGTGDKKLRENKISLPKIGYQYHNHALS